MHTKRILCLLLTAVLLLVPAAALETPADDPWGITMTLEDVTPTGASVVFTQSGGSPSGELSTGAPYWLEAWSDSRWTPIDIGEVAWIMPAYDIPEGGTRVLAENWTHLYGTLPNGAYRIGKTVMDLRNPGDYDQQVYYAEFSFGLVGPFRDVTRDDWYADAVQYVSETGLMNGTTDVTFSPGGVTTRGQIVTILWWQAGSPVVNYILPFHDVDQESYCGEAVRWAASQGIVTGYADGSFRPDAPITREQLAATLWRFARDQGMDVSVGEDTNILSYEDAFTISEYAIPAIQWACGAGVMSGYQDGRLDPHGQALRSHAAVMMMNFLKS